MYVSVYVVSRKFGGSSLVTVLDSGYIGTVSNDEDGAVSLCQSQLSSGSDVSGGGCGPWCQPGPAASPATHLSLPPT